jgi:large subunit ribosomal protein L6
MSRIARKPLNVPTSVELTLVESELSIKGKKGTFVHQVHSAVSVELEGHVVWVRAKDKAHPMVGTTRKLLANMVQGVSEGFESKLLLVGVGYRAKTQGNTIELSLGFSNPAIFEVPEGVSVETPTNTEIILKGIDRQLVGETAAKIRALRPPEPYKGKGIRYANEKVVIKETKKK